MKYYQKLIVTGVCLLSVRSVQAEDTSIDTPRPIYSDITPLSGPVVHNWAEFFVTADFIYWQARQDGLSYAQDGNYNFVAAPPQTAHRGRYKNLDFDCEPGFKAGIGVDFRHDGWYLSSNYTWLQQDDAHGHATNDPTHRGQLVSQFLYSAIFGLPALPLPLDSAKARWKLHFNDIDLELGRHFYISRRLELNPYVGMKGAWINQKYRVTNTALFPLGTIVMRQKQDFWGVGLRAGLNSEWHFTRNWSIYGALAISELYCQFETTRKDVETSGPTPGILYYVENNFHTVKPVVEMSLGFRYETFFSNDRYQLFLQAGWEEQVWFDHNQLNAIINPTGKGDLVFQGLDVKFGFSF